MNFRSVCVRSCDPLCRPLTILLDEMADGLEKALHPDVHVVGPLSLSQRVHPQLALVGRHLEGPVQHGRHVTDLIRVHKQSLTIKG